jgi:hypothetical protein
MARELALKEGLMVSVLMMYRDSLFVCFLVVSMDNNL